jgi:hypothetical protein
MNRIHENPGYSATVRLNLVYAGGVVPLEQVAGDWVIPEKSVVLPPGEAQVVVEVDGRESKRNVYLPEGMSGVLDTRVPIRPI